MQFVMSHRNRIRDLETSTSLIILYDLWFNLQNAYRDEYYSDAIIRFMSHVMSCFYGPLFAQESEVSLYKDVQEKSHNVICNIYPILFHNQYICNYL